MAQREATSLAQREASSTRLKTPHMSQDELSQSLAELSGLLFAQETLDTTLHRVAVLASHLLPGADAASVTVADSDGKPSTASSTQDLASQLDAEQYRLDEGPCLAALRERELFQIDSMADETRWSQFCPLALDAGIASLLAVPLAANGTSGAINFYSRRSYIYTSVDRAIASLFAGQAAVAAANAQSYTSVQGERDKLALHLNEALRSRATIDQAVGVLVEREHLNPTEAFEMLRTASQRLNVKIRDIAGEIVAAAQESGSPRPTGRT